MSRTAICNNHDEIIGHARNIYRYATAIRRSEDLNEIYSIAEKIIDCSNDVESEAIDAKDSGQAMEARCKNTTTQSTDWDSLGTSTENVV